VRPIFDSILIPRILAALRHHVRSLEPSARRLRWGLIRRYARDTLAGDAASTLDFPSSKGDGVMRTFKRKDRATLE
jgi:hypothetical protein